MSTTLARRRKAAAPVRPVVTPEGVAADIVNLLSGIERVGADAPAAIAFRMAIRRKGRELAEACGAPALKGVLGRVRAADPERADAREAVITTEWANLPGWEA